MDKYKILGLFACHTKCIKKYFTNLNNIYYLLDYLENFIIIDSKDEYYAELLKKDVEKISKFKEHYFIDNDIYYDFGKWVYGIETINYYDYDYILLINDSIIIVNNMFDFFKGLNDRKPSVNIYAYNDSTQLDVYHYQSYLFFLNKKILYKFKNY